MALLPVFKSLESVYAVNFNVAKVIKIVSVSLN